VRQGDPCVRQELFLSIVPKPIYLKAYTDADAIRYHYVVHVLHSNIPYKMFIECGDIPPKSHGIHVLTGNICSQGPVSLDAAPKCTLGRNHLCTPNPQMYTIRHQHCVD
jgi:hypothetical protein